MHSELIGLADLALDAGQLDAAALLLGAADAFDVRLGYAPFRERPTMKDHTQTAIRRQLDPAAFDRAWAQSHSLSLDEAIAEALAIAATLSA